MALVKHMLANDGKSNKVVAMSELEGEARIGWGEPLELTGAEADDVRRVLNGHNKDSPEFESALERAKRIAMPPVAECEDTRGAIERVAHFIANLESSPHPEDRGYDEHHDKLNRIYAGASRAYEDRIPGCEMKHNDDEDLYKCERCEFRQYTWL